MKEPSLPWRGEALVGKAEGLGRVGTAFSAAWAATQENIAIALVMLGDQAQGELRAEHYQAAELAVSCALEVLDPENMPFNFDKATRLLTRVQAKLSGED